MLKFLITDNRLARCYLEKDINMSYITLFVVSQNGL